MALFHENNIFLLDDVIFVYVTCTHANKSACKLRLAYWRQNISNESQNMICTSRMQENYSLHISDKDIRQLKKAL